MLPSAPPGGNGSPPAREDDDEAPPLSVPPLSTAEPLAYRLMGRRQSSMPPPTEQEFLTALTDLLLAAARADGDLCRRELRAIRRILARLSGTEDVPDWLETHIAGFDLRHFDFGATTARLRELHAEQRRHVMELVREVCDADNAFGLEEERYLIGLVFALSLDHSEVSDLVVHQAKGLDGVPKRLFDLAFSTAFLFFAWPLLLGIAAGIKATSKGPVLFRQARYGREGARIQVLKFRTMIVTEDGASVPQATKSDPRVTRFGAFLRRTSLDELPQFINVLRGDMSVVGPRPHAVAHNEQYRTRILEYMLRHKVKPGITGYAQVNGWRGETDTLDKMIQRVRHDLEYIRRQSLWLDVRIIVATVFGRRARENAY
jgi:lipopolysaccharide/colanic/teichoic acid biosynthesis glycosyltransferase